MFLFFFFSVLFIVPPFLNMGLILLNSMSFGFKKLLTNGFFRVSLLTSSDFFSSYIFLWIMLQLKGVVLYSVHILLLVWCLVICCVPVFLLKSETINLAFKPYVEYLKPLLLFTYSIFVSSYSLLLLSFSVQVTAVLLLNFLFKV